MRERKSNAQKQFAYNKLKNEKQITLKHEHQKVSSAPKRPPQPKLGNFEKKEKEGMLIDLTSPQQQENIPSLIPNGVFDNAFALKLNDMSILDAPIDVPTQGYPDEELNALGLFDSESNKPEPPPYQSPPTYMNTYGLNKPSSNYACSSSTLLNQYGNIDPFDTSHVVTPQAKFSGSHYSVEDGFANSNNFLRNQIQTTSFKDVGYLGQHRSSITSEIDEIVQNKMASLSPKVGHKLRNSMITIATPTYAPINTVNNESPPKTSENSVLSDSLKVNLSSLTLNDTDDFELQVFPSVSAEQNPKLDQAFLAELEKEIYKNDNAAKNINVNSAQCSEFSIMNTKANTVNTISNSLSWLKNDFPMNNVVTAQVYQQQKNVSAMQSPAKFPNEAIKMTNSESASTSMTLSKKLYNTEINSADPNEIYSASVNQMGTNNVTVSTMNGGNQAIYSNYSMANAHSSSSVPIASHDQKYNFVTSDKYACGVNPNNRYSVSSDIYGSVACGNVYDVVASSNSDYYQAFQQSNGQTVIYDEVAADDIRPHRPAPGPPVLSAQQIQRRIERAQKGQTHQIYDNLDINNEYSNATSTHSIYEEINQKTKSNGTEHESKVALNAANSGTIKNIKIEQLLR